MGSLLAVYDPSGELGLTDPSPGGGSVPTHDANVPYSDHDFVLGPCLRCGCSASDYSSSDQCYLRVPTLLLVTEDGTPDPIGMARAREVLARVMGFRFCSRCREIEGDCHCAHLGDDPEWAMYLRLPGGGMTRMSDESTPETLAQLLADHTDCEVLRG